MLRECLDSVLSAESVPAEVLVVDQSTPPDETLVRGLRPPDDCDVRHVRTRTEGTSRANNLGAELATYDVLLFTHDDVRVDRSWPGRLAGSLLKEADPRTVVTGRILPLVEKEDGYAPTLRMSRTPAEYRGRPGLDVLKPLNMAVRREVLRGVGGFDERLGPGTPFPGAEDADLGFRLLESGCRIRYLPAALVHHRAWRREEDYLPLRWRYGVAQGAFYAKHLPGAPGHFLMRGVRDTLRRARRFPMRLVAEGRRALGDPLFLVGNLVGAIRWWGRRAAGRFARGGRVGGV